MRSTDLFAGVAGLLLAACGPGAVSGAAGAAGQAGSSGAAGVGGAGIGGAAGSAGSASAGAPADDPPELSAADLAAFAKLAPAELPAPPSDATNRFADDPKAAAFGQRLFFDTSFSGELTDGDNDGTVNALGMRGETGKVSCAGCHVAEHGFSDTRTLGKQISLGAGWGRRKAPSLLDIGQAKLLMWDGRHDTFYNQVFGPLESPVEMNSSRLYLAQRIFELHRTEYESLFGPMPPMDDEQRFPKLTAELTGCQPTTVDPAPTCNGTQHGLPGDLAEYDSLGAADKEAVTQVVVNFGKALGAYQRLLTCGPSRFDAWVHGKQGALSNSEQRGAQLFVGRGKCASCHSGPYFSDQGFHNVGLKPAIVAVVFLDHDDEGAATGLVAAHADPLNSLGKFSDGDDGRLPQVVTPGMLGAFRTPTLRCVSGRPAFMHTGQMKTLSSVVSHFSQGGDLFGFLGNSELAALDLTSRDEQDLVAFLQALDGPGPAAELRVAPTATP